MSGINEMSMGNGKRKCFWLPCSLKLGHQEARGPSSRLGSVPKPAGWLRASHGLLRASVASSDKWADALGAAHLTGLSGEQGDT